MHIDRTNLGEKLALCALVFYIATELLFRYSALIISYPVISTSNMLIWCEYAAMGMAIAAIILRPRSISPYQAILAAATFALLLFSSSRTLDYRLVHGLIILFAVSGIDLRKLCSAYYMTTMPIIAIVMLLAVIGLEHNVDVIPNSRLVFSYGFQHPNTTGCLLFSALGAMAYAHWESKTWIAPCLLSGVAGVFCYAFLSSHASAALLLALAAITAFGHTKPGTKLAKIPHKPGFALLACVPLLLMGIALACTAFFDSANPFMNWFNGIVHGRPLLAHNYYLGHDGFTLFGREYSPTVDYHSGLPFTSVDSGYSFLPLVTGIIPMLLLFANYLAASWQLLKKPSNYFVVMILLMQSFYFLVEFVPALLVLNFSVLFISEAYTLES